MDETLKNDEIGEYIFSKDPKRKDRWSISGPDTDQLCAVNMWGMLKAVQFAREKGELPELEVLTDQQYEGDVKGGDLGLGLRRYGMPFNVRGELSDRTGTQADIGAVTQEQIEFVRRTYSDVIAIGKKQVLEWGQQQPSVINIPRLLFVEGFLLYPRPDSQPRTTPKFESCVEVCVDSSSFTRRMAAEKATKEDKIHTKILTSLAHNLSRGEILEDRQMDFVQEHHYLSLARAFHKLNSLLDVKLFLPTSHDVAKKRRMERPEYIDERKGGRRKPGQMWKTEGYFEDVAWMHHVIEHQQIADWGGAPKVTMEAKEAAIKCGIDVRGEVDASLENTVSWAVNVILDQLKRR